MKKKSKTHPIETHIKKQGASLVIQKVLVGLSGGPDSIATAYALKQSGFEIIALHCNFHLRGEESNRDMNFVDVFCQKYCLPLKIIDFDVKSYIESHKGESIEMACRNLRHEWFRQQLEETGFDRLVTGHNADDNIETFFLNMLRGSGTRGLKGMTEDNGRIWRPLLSFNRKDILEYLRENNLDYIIDSTNLESDFRRNYLRNEIIPRLKSMWEGFDSAMMRTIDHLNGENKVVEKLLEEILSKNPSGLSVKDIIEFADPLLLLKRFIDPFGPFVSTPSEILGAIKANKPRIRRWRLKKGYVFLRNGRLFIEISHSEGCPG